MTAVGSGVSGLSLWHLKLLLAAVTFAVGVIGVTAPRLLFQRADSRSSVSKYGVGLSLGNMLSAGVMMSASLVHLLAESNENLKEAMGPPEQGEEPYPWAMVLCGVGFLVTLIPAQLLEPPSDERQCLDCATDNERSKDLPAAPGAAILTRGISGQFQSHPWHREGSLDHGHRLGHDHCCSHMHATRTDDQADARSMPTQPARLLEEPLLTSTTDCEHQLSPEKAPPRTSNVSSLMLTLSLVIHSAFEGAAIGAQNETGASISVAVAVLAHKGLAGYAIGSSMVSCTMTRTQQLPYMLMFALATPFGILLGTLLSVSVEDTIWAAVISAASSGTFLYSAVVEVLGNELRVECFDLDSPHRTLSVKLSKFAFFIAGFVAMCIVSKYT